ncbi:MAG: glycosyltransferase family 4 protein [Phycisphaeraceae bacterium]|nr:glycosyltransferase family 4 protein [Phycisphaeraceae bacterium]
MKTLQIITRLIQGGAQRVVVDTCAHLVRQGHEVHLAYGPIYGPEGSLLDDARASGAVLHEISSMVRQVAPLRDWLCYKKLRQLIRQLKPDVVHTHSSKAGILGRAAAWKEKVPLIVHTVHGLPFHEHQLKIVHHFYVSLEREAAKHCHHMIAVSEAMVDAFVQEKIAPREQFTVIHSGIDVARFSADRSQSAAVKRQLGIAADEPVLGIVARLDKLKGHADLFHMMIDMDRHLLCIGDGWSRSDLEQRVRELGIESSVTFTGLVSPDEVARLLTCVDVCVLPSYQEGQGLVLAEALLAGCAIAGYDTGGIGAVCIEGQTGKLVPTGDENALRDAIRWLLDHPDQAAELTRRGQQLVREKFSSAAMVKQIERLYGDLLQIH